MYLASLQNIFPPIGLAETRARDAVFHKSTRTLFVDSVRKTPEQLLNHPSYSHETFPGSSCEPLKYWAQY